jgi:hypothetical protein
MTITTDFNRNLSVGQAENFVQARKVVIIALALTTAFQRLDTLLTSAVWPSGFDYATKKNRIIALRVNGLLADGTTNRNAIAFADDSASTAMAWTGAGLDATLPALDVHLDQWVKLSGAQTVQVEVYYIP